MSPARAHRERHAAIAAGLASPAPIRSTEEGGQPAATPPMTPAREHLLTLAVAELAGAAPSANDAAPANREAAQIQLRLAHDLRRLKEIQSIEKKIEAKREMLPAYDAWIDAQLAAAEDGKLVEGDEVLPTIMVWRIDVGDFVGAILLAEHVLTHKLPLPARYQRTAPALIVEEIATAALKAQAAGAAFPLEILQHVAGLTADDDMHDEIRAKLVKAIGVEQMRAAEDEAGEPLVRAATAALSLETLRRAQQLNERVGVKDRIKRLEKMLAPPKEPAASAA